MKLLRDAVEVTERQMGRYLSDEVMHPGVSLLVEQYEFYRGMSVMAKLVMKWISDE